MTAPAWPAPTATQIRWNSPSEYLRWQPSRCQHSIAPRLGPVLRCVLGTGHRGEHYFA